jgi:maltodextrin utilization protein YvdJ
MMSGWTPNLGLVLLMYLVEIIIGLIVPVASIRFARTNSLSEAFNVRAILEYIGKIGWINYIIALILVALVIGIPIAILVIGFILLGGITMFMFKVSNIAILGFILALVIIILTLAPLFAVFQARYMTCVYDSAVPEG